VTLQIFLDAERYFSVLKWLSLALLGYVAAFVVVFHSSGALARDLLPPLTLSARFWTTLLAVLGTTISPYVFLWQASQEAADTRRASDRRPLKQEPAQAPGAIGRIRLDTYAGMGLATLVGISIMATTAVTLREAHIYNVDTSIQAARALRPIAGRFASSLFAIGILSTGLLSIPALASSAAYALAETRRWPRGLARLPREAKRFYGTIAAATVIGAVINASPVTPIQALYLSATINGLVAAPVMILMMRLSNDPQVMGRLRVTGILRGLGWLATLLMSAAAAGVIASLLASASQVRSSLLP
jgi:Mn2+/Fe2+ NRAMP family transporter